jgi:hypothetical protein
MHEVSFDVTSVINPAAEAVTGLPGWAWGIITPIVLFLFKVVINYLHPTTDARTKLYYAILSEMTNTENWCWETKSPPSAEPAAACILLKCARYVIEIQLQPEAVTSLVSTATKNTQLLDILHPKHKTRLYWQAVALKDRISARLADLHKELSDKQTETQATAVLAAIK